MDSNTATWKATTEGNLSRVSPLTLLASRPGSPPAQEDSRPQLRRVASCPPNFVVKPPRFPFPTHPISPPQLSYKITPTPPTLSGRSARVAAASDEERKDKHEGSNGEGHRQAADPPAAPRPRGGAEPRLSGHLRENAPSSVPPSLTLVRSGSIRACCSDRALSGTPDPRLTDWRFVYGYVAGERVRGGGQRGVPPEAGLRRRRRHRRVSGFSFMC